MAESKYSSVCLSEVDEQQRVNPANRQPVQERLENMPEGYTKAIISGLKMAFPDKLGTDEEAYLAFDVMKAMIFNGLRNGDVVDVEGLGELRVEPRDGKKQVVYTPDPNLIVAVNE